MEIWSQECFISLDLEDPYGDVNGGGSLHSSFDATNAFRFTAFGCVQATGHLYTYHLYASVGYVNENLQVSLSSEVPGSER